MKGQIPTKEERRVALMKRALKKVEVKRSSLSPKVQKRIESVLKLFGWMVERRKRV